MIRKRSSNRMPCFGDFEASGLAADTYPIEVAWSLPDGDIHSSLIRIDDGWNGGYWDPQAESLHGISQARLAAEGRPAKEICEWMNAELDGENLYFDGEDYDRLWLTMLFEAGGVKPTFVFRDFNILLFRLQIFSANRLVAVQAIARADIRDLPKHRAAHDVKYLQRCYLRARGGLRH